MAAGCPTFGVGRWVSSISHLQSSAAHAAMKKVLRVPHPWFIRVGPLNPQFNDQRVKTILRPQPPPFCDFQSLSAFALTELGAIQKPFCGGARKSPGAL